MLPAPACDHGEGAEPAAAAGGASRRGRPARSARRKAVTAACPLGATTGRASMNSKWDARFLELAEFVSKWSKDKAKVGAVLATPRSGAIALGYNGFPIGVEDRAERLEDPDIKLDMVVHAEQNALLIAGPAALG